MYHVFATEKQLRAYASDFGLTVLVVIAATVLRIRANPRRATASREARKFRANPRSATASREA